MKETIEFPVFKNFFGNIEKKNSISINLFYYENELTYPVYVSNQTIEGCMDLFMITNENKS